MRSRDGLKLLDHTSFTGDVEGQIARGRLRLGIHEDRVRALLPHIEAALGSAGFAFEHSGLNANATGHISVMNLDGLLYRAGITGESRHRKTGTPPMLHMDSSWCGAGGARGDLGVYLVLDDSADETRIHQTVTQAAAVFREHARQRNGDN